MRIETERLVLRPRQEADFDAYWAIVSDFEVTKNLGSKWTYPPDADFVRERCAPYPVENGVVFSVLEAGRLVGSLGFTNGTFGYFYAPSAWGRCIATEAGRAGIAYIFDSYNWPALEAGVWADNAASIRVLEKLGFLRTGESTDYCGARAQDVFGYDFKLTRERWHSLSPRENSPKST